MRFNNRGGLRIIDFAMNDFSLLDVGGLLESVQDRVEKRWGKLWSWVVYFGLFAAFLGGVAWAFSYLASL